MNPQVIQVGPLASATATKVGLAQKAAIAGTNYVVLNGAAGSFTANSVCASQTPGGAVALTLNGTLASSAPTGTAIGYLPGPSRIYITGGSDESGKTFAVVGRRFGGIGGAYYAVTETITGPNASTASSLNLYDQIISITSSAGTAGAITVGHYRTATLDTARRVLFTSGGDDSAASVVVSGGDYAGLSISETLALTNGSTAYTVQDFLTITSITTSAAIATTISVGTNGVASSPWASFDGFPLGNAVGQCVVTGTVSYTVQQTMDDPSASAASNPVARASMAWASSGDTNVVTATASQMTSFTNAPRYARILMNSNTNPGKIVGTFTQFGSASV